MKYLLQAANDRLRMSGEGMFVEGASTRIFLVTDVINFAPLSQSSCVQLCYQKFSTLAPWLFPLEHHRCVKRCTCSKRSWGERRLHPLVRAKWLHRLLTQCLAGEGCAISLKQLYFCALAWSICYGLKLWSQLSAI